MTAFGAFILSWVIGYLTVILVLRKTKNVDAFLVFFLAAGLGAGASSLLTFASFLIFKGFNRTAIFLIHLAVFVLLIALNARLNQKGILGQKRTLIDPAHLAPAVFFASFFAIVYVLAKTHPFGEWDSWAVWTMKAKFLSLSGGSWADVSRKLHWHTQPDYPLLLPFMIVWGWSVSQKDFFDVALAASVIFTISCAGLLFAGLKQVLSDKKSLLVAFLLLSSSGYVFLGTSQYADILLAYYLLACLICFALAQKENNTGFMFLCGMILGFLSFTKNEGVVMSVLFFALNALHFLPKKRGGNQGRFAFFRSLCLGLLITLPATVIFKLSLTAPNRDILAASAEGFQFLNWEGCYLIVTSLMSALGSADTRWIWLIVFSAAVLGYKNLRGAEIKILWVFLFSYLLIVFCVYLTTEHFNLAWRLSRTLGRILFYLLPSFLFLSFYSYSQNKKIG